MSPMAIEIHQAFPEEMYRQIDAVRKKSSAASNGPWLIYESPAVNPPTRNGLGDRPLPTSIKFELPLFSLPIYIR